MQQKEDNNGEDEVKREEMKNVGSGGRSCWTMAVMVDLNRVVWCGYGMAAMVVWFIRTRSEQRRKEHLWIRGKKTQFEMDFWKKDIDQIWDEEIIYGVIIIRVYVSKAKETNVYVIGDMTLWWRALLPTQVSETAAQIWTKSKPRKYCVQAGGLLIEFPIY